MARTVTLRELVVAIEARQAVINKADLLLTKTVARLGTLDKACADTLAFLAKASYKSKLATTQAGVVIVDDVCLSAVPKTSIPLVVKSPYLAYASVSGLFAYQPKKPFAVHPTAIIGDNVVLGDNVAIGAHCVIGDNVVLGDDVKIGAHCVIGDNVTIGDESCIDSHVVIYHHCQIGGEARIHSHATVGAEGFGFAPSANPSRDGWQRIAQLGRVVIGNRVRIGANTCIDRGALDDTIIADDVIIDNLVQIAHNVVIGQGTAIAAKTGIAGSTVIGKGCVIGGAVGIAGHLHIADFVTITGRTFVAQSIAQAGSYSSGTLAMPSARWRRAAIRFRQLGE